MILKFFRDLPRSMLLTYTSLALLAGGGAAFAATSYDVHNNPDMFLNKPITAVQTTGIELAAPVRNGATVIFPTLSGGILKLQFGLDREELIYYSTGAVNSTTKVITLYGVTRDVCWNVARSIQGCGAGKQFPKSTNVRMVDAAQLLNLKANVDRVNTFTAEQRFGSGVSLTGSGYGLDLSRLTTTERDAMTNVKNGRLIYNKTTSLVNQYVGGAWVAVGTDATANASETVAGKLQVGTLDMLLNRTMTGSTGAQNALAFRWIVKNGTGSSTAGYVVQTGNNGAVSPSLGGTGLAGATQSGVLIGNGSKNSMLQITASSGQYLRANSKGSWFAYTPSGDLAQWSQPTEKLTTSVGDQNFVTNYTFPANYATGSIVVIEATGTGASAGAAYRYGLKLGSTEICASNQQDPGTTRAPWRLQAKLQLKRNGAQGILETNCFINGGNSSTTSGSLVAINTTTTNAVNIFLRSNGTNAYSYLTNIFVTPFLR